MIREECKVSYYHYTKENAEDYTLFELKDILEGGYLHLFPFYVTEYIVEILKLYYRKALNEYKRGKIDERKQPIIIVDNKYIRFDYDRNYPIKNINEQSLKELLKHYSKKRIEDYFEGGYTRLMADELNADYVGGDFYIQEMPVNWYTEYATEIYSLTRWILGKEEAEEYDKKLNLLFEEIGKRKNGDSFDFEEGNRNNNRILKKIKHEIDDIVTRMESSKQLY